MWAHLLGEACAARRDLEAQDGFKATALSSGALVTVEPQIQKWSRCYQACLPLSTCVAVLLLLCAL